MIRFAEIVRFIAQQITGITNVFSSSVPSTEGVVRELRVEKSQAVFVPSLQTEPITKQIAVDLLRENPGVGCDIVSEWWKWIYVPTILARGGNFGNAAYIRQRNSVDSPYQFAGPLKIPIDEDEAWEFLGRPERSADLWIGAATTHKLNILIV